MTGRRPDQTGTRGPEPWKPAPMHSHRQPLSHCPLTPLCPGEALSAKGDFLVGLHLKCMASPPFFIPVMMEGGRAGRAHAMMHQAEGDEELAAVAALGARTAGSAGAGAVRSAWGPAAMPLLLAAPREPAPPCAFPGVLVRACRGCGTAGEDVGRSTFVHFP